MSLTSPERTPAWTAAPSATTSSGFTPRFGSLPKNSLTVSCTIGMRVEPPTRTTSSMSSTASCRRPRAPSCTGSIERSTRSSIICSNFARDELDLQVLRAGRVGGEERQVDLRLLRATTARSWPSPPPP